MEIAGAKDRVGGRWLQYMKKQMVRLINWSLDDGKWTTAEPEAKPPERERPGSG